MRGILFIGLPLHQGSARDLRVAEFKRTYSLSSMPFSRFLPVFEHPLIRPRQWAISGSAQRWSGV
jgi:hypothetical protein